MPTRADTFLHDQQAVNALQIKGFGGHGINVSYIGVRESGEWSMSRRGLNSPVRGMRATE
jgi:hypothetical protein